MSKSQPIEIKGIVIEGHGVASRRNKESPYPRGTLEMQLPFFKERGLDLSAMHLATINVSIEPCTFSIEIPKYCLTNVNWTPNHPPETFSFCDCEIIFKGTTYAGYIYYPHPEFKVRHFQSPSMLEVIAPWIEGIKYGSQVTLRLKSGQVRIIE